MRRDQTGHVVTRLWLQTVGETWEKFPELKFLALKRMYKYMVRGLCMSSVAVCLLLYILPFT